MKRRLRIVTRKSKLAWIQASLVQRRILEVHPDCEVELTGITTAGDRTQSEKVSIADKRDFIRTLEDALVQEQADIAVHSLKDLPASASDRHVIYPVLTRADPRDALVGASSLLDLPIESKIGTSSLRRQASLTFFLKQTNIFPIRGNVDTRIQKLDNAEYDALILASAGLDRLNLSGRIGQRLDPTVFVPAPCQGVIAAEVREGDEYVQSIVTKLQIEQVQLAATCERKIVEILGIGCNVPIGIYCDIQASGCVLHCLVLDTAGSHAIQLQLEGMNPLELTNRAIEQLDKAGVEKLLN
ncbi:MAG: hydroxymethylbilane synthase [Gammaproteobacteria bacterium]|nr:hydroxymethylbilane synthase [Gammaproteobacteria bacterium]MDE0252182.1 hydroxymethylbilane synthase [Gammaproteobacteria bacterium]MDE0402709.1 hydroxymethylbilane synthase [Gammaproteobacteria bacterium]MDE0646189.1 hydroxymethylbilane synthase [Gammaproteobacteria bacterium]